MLSILLVMIFMSMPLLLSAVYGKYSKLAWAVSIFTMLVVSTYLSKLWQDFPQNAIVTLVLFVPMLLLHFFIWMTVRGTRIENQMIMDAIKRARRTK